MTFIKLPSKLDTKSKTQVAELQLALGKLKLAIDQRELETKTFGKSTVAGIKQLQEKNGLNTTGKLSEDTIKAINTELFDNFIATNKSRSVRVFKLLEALALKIDPKEKEAAQIGKTARKAIESIQKKEKLPVDGKISEEFLIKLNDLNLKSKLYSASKNQRGLLQKTLVKVSKISQLNLEIEPLELKSKTLGASSVKLIKAFQEKYKLPVTGMIDSATISKLNSVGASKGVFLKRISKPQARDLALVKKALRLNKVSPEVNHAQKALAYLGFKIAMTEFNTQKFGKTTQKAVLDFQKSRGLNQTGRLENKDLKILNGLIQAANPVSGAILNKYRVKGSVRNELWERKANMVIKIYEQGLDGESSVPLMTKKNFLNGFFDIIYSPPIDPSTGKVKEKFHLVVKLYSSSGSNPANDKLVMTKTCYNVNKLLWMNFTEGEDAYQGDSEFTITQTLLQAAIGNKEIHDLKETATEKQITQLAKETTLNTNDIMYLVLSHKVMKTVNKPQLLGAEVFYAFIRQSLPSSLPGDLLRGTALWKDIEAITETTAKEIVLLEGDFQELTIKNALAENLVPRSVKANLAAILQELANQRTVFTLEKSILSGNQNLKKLLSTSKIKPAHYTAVANAFINKKGFNTDFWQELKSSGLIEAGAIEDFNTSVDIGRITTNHTPTIEFLKRKIGRDIRLKNVKSITKLDQASIVALITENGSSVPDGTPGVTAADKVSAFAASIKTRASLLFPEVSLIAEIKKTNIKLTKVAAIETFIDEHADLNFKQDNIDRYLSQKGISMEAVLKNELKTVQRIHKLTPDPVAGSVLINEGLHSSKQIYLSGKNRLLKKLAANGVSEQAAIKLYESSQMQYLQILGTFLNYRPETNSYMPAAIISQTYSQQDAQHIPGDTPDLEALFGSMDYCACSHCKSLFGPAAYLADLLRFIHKHDSLVRNGANYKTVKDILLERRPDIGNIKLDCQNTNTALPYIDLVCEILENRIEPIPVSPSMNQTTLSEKELRAMPQYIRPQAYRTLATADFPMNSSFNLFLEETRIYLDYLQLPRYKLMEAFQNKAPGNSGTPSDSAIAAEFFSISPHERSLITKQETLTEKLNVYWGINTVSSAVSVSDFMKRSGMNYNEALELLLVKFVNGPSTGNRSEIISLPGNCDTDTQKINNLTKNKFDLMHRFIRLWRKTGWKMWELDLLLRNPLIGNNTINDEALIKLKRFKHLQEKLKLPVESLLAFYGELNRELRVSPENPESRVDPLYNLLFQNNSITNPVDPNFKAIGDNGEPINLKSALFTPTPPDNYTPVPVILSALSINQDDYKLLLKPNALFSVETLSHLFRYTALAKSLNLNIKNLLTLLEVSSVSDPFASPEETERFISHLEQLKASGLSLPQFDYLVHYRPESALVMKEESIIQLLSKLRTAMNVIQERIKQLNDLINAIDHVTAPSVIDPNEPNVNPFGAAFGSLQDKLVVLKEFFAGSEFPADKLAMILNLKQEELKSISDNNKVALLEVVNHLRAKTASILEKQAAQNGITIVSITASACNISPEHAELLLNKLKPAQQDKTIVEVLSDKKLVEKGPEGNYTELTPATFPDAFHAFALLHKMAVIINGLKLSAADLAFVTAHGDKAGLQDLSTFPVTATAGKADFDKLLTLVNILKFKSLFPEAEEDSFYNILISGSDTSTSFDILTEAISKLSGWNLSDLKTLMQELGIDHTSVLDYAKTDSYLRLQRCFGYMKAAGVDAGTMLRWAEITNDLLQDEKTANETRLAIKSKYEQDTWLQKISPLQDLIREKKRKALVEFHLEYSQRNQALTTVVNGRTIKNPLYWNDSNTMYKFLLIDVEMSACALTSRIALAIASVQLFVQRCFLNLESGYVMVSEDEKLDVASANAWSQWKWIKNYRIWEANRKVFFYPENWLEPELRNDKSPFFRELESEIMQNDITDENVESAFGSYLHKIDEVANLEICGLYHERENLSGDLNMYEVNKIHVTGRTKNLPHVYYYRSYDMIISSWGAWEKIDADIKGDHLVPVVYNRRLHLFWLQFMEKPMEVKKTPPAMPSYTPQDVPAAGKLIEVQLGWTIKNSNGWSSKKTSKQKLIHPWERPHESYNLRPYYSKSDNLLYIDLYISTSKEFNDRLFYNQYEHKLTKLTKTQFNETFLPWHSSSFVFNGDVKDVELKALRGTYRMPEHTRPQYTDSFQYVYENFGNDGKAIKVMPIEDSGARLRLPNGMHFKYSYLTNNQVHSINLSQLRILEDTVTTTLLNKAIAPFALIIPQQVSKPDIFSDDSPMFYQDNKRAYFIKPEGETNANGNSNRTYRFLPFHHPYTPLFIREFNRNGIRGLLNRKIQTSPQSYIQEQNNNFNFSLTYAPVPSVKVDSTAERYLSDFSFGGAYSVYNWELFFHAPLMIACRLSQNQKFEDAMNWFHYIFNPTNIESLPSPQRYWVTKPFFEQNAESYRTQRIGNILEHINLPEHQDQLKAWKNNPFNPHVIAQYRTVAYQKNVVMKYIDNLIAWGDMLYRKDSQESINEASLLYMLAYEILGDRPKKVPTMSSDTYTYNELEHKLNSFGNARVDVMIENILLPIAAPPAFADTEAVPNIETFYFCTPANDYLARYWDTVEDRLYKIRHCMNVDGIKRSLPLFEPPIDPALLMRAAAGGINTAAIMNDTTMPLPNYRFRVMIQKAMEFCHEVKNLGEKLAAALEKNDAEQLSLMRSQGELSLLEAISEVRRKQIAESEEAIVGLNTAFEIAREKEAFYTSREFMNSWEAASLAASGISIGIDAAVSLSYAFATAVSAAPQFVTGASGFGGTPVATVSIGGQNLGNSAQTAAQGLAQVTKTLDKISSVLNTQGSYQRRKDEWDLHGRLAALEKNQIQAQINAAEIRRAITEHELSNHELQIENATSIDSYMRNKYTNQQLYSWMTTQLSGVYFSAYELAYNMAKKAEKCFQYELGITNSAYIQYGYWDNLKKGLLSGDSLMTDLKKLESAYMEENTREYEITKHVSLAQMFPLSLVTLRNTGKCLVQLDEWLFDMDYPGHYKRRIKNVSVSIPCITGPYTSVNCTLSLLKNETRISATLLNGVYEKDPDNDDPRFRTMLGAISSIATSSGQNDSGMFQLNFQDDRYLPFEGVGAISTWQLEMPACNNYFDFNSLSDVVLHINYTSRNGGGLLTSAANQHLKSVLPDNTSRLFDIKHEFGNEWYRFLNPETKQEQEIILNLRPEHFPFFIRRKLNTLKIKKLDLFIESPENSGFRADIQIANNHLSGLFIGPGLECDHVLHRSEDLSNDAPTALSQLKLKLKVNGSTDFMSLHKNQIDNLFILLSFG